MDLPSLQAYTVIILRHRDRYLLLQRSPAKAFAPDRWTGVGGHVEPDEYSDLNASALREMNEETGFTLDEVRNFTLRRVLLTNRPGHSLGIVLYYTGDLANPEVPECSEGSLAWKSADEFAGLDIIETTRPVLDRLVEDMERDPFGTEPPKTGLGVFHPDGVFKFVLWGSSQAVE